MPDLIANSVFTAAGREYRPGEKIPPELPEREKLIQKGFVVWEGGERAVREAAECEAAEQTAKEAAEREAAEQEAREAAEQSAKTTKPKKPAK